MTEAAEPMESNDFVAASAAVKFKAVVLIQKWYRRYKALLELRRRKIWVIYEKMEHAKNTHLINLLRETYNEMKRLNSAKDGPEELIQASKTPDLTFYQRILQYGSNSDKDLASCDFGNAGFEDIQIEKSYSGVHLTFPITSIQVQNMIESFKAHQILHEKYLLQLAHEARLALKVKPNINLVCTSISKQVTIVGSLTGHIADLMAIFNKNGLPDSTNPYIFNGGFVNMGPHSTQVIAVLCASLLAWPTGVFMNRGVHEDAWMCNQHGFQKELKGLYRTYSDRLSIAFNEMFSVLPLATIVDKRVFVTHGGISDKLDLEAVNNLYRGKYISPYDMQLNNESTEQSDPELDQVVDMIWNLPRQKPGCEKNATDQIIGKFFGPDVTAEFMKLHGFSLMIRTRSSLIDGYDYCHNHTVLTVSSVSGKVSAPGVAAYAKVDDKGMVHVSQFNIKAAYSSIGKQVSQAEEDAMRALRAKIAASESPLTTEFQFYDKNKTGDVTVEEWCKSMKSVLQLDLPWYLLHRHLTVPNKDSTNMVNYMTTFNKVAIKYRKEEASSVTEILYKNKDELESVFRLLDRQGVGYITWYDFKECCRLVCAFMDKKELTDDEIEAMNRMLDLNADGKIDYNEFLEAFRIVEVDPAPLHQKN